MTLKYTAGAQHSRINVKIPNVTLIAFKRISSILLPQPRFAEVNVRVKRYPSPTLINVNLLRTSECKFEENVLIVMFNSMNFPTQTSCLEHIRLPDIKIMQR